MNAYSWIVKAHTAFAVLSLLIYGVRGVLMLVKSPAVVGKLALTSATTAMLLLLVSGGWLAWASGHGLDGFVVTKLLGLTLYLLLGTIALKPGLSKPVAIGLWLAGLAAFISTFMVAMRWLPVLY